MLQFYEGLYPLLLYICLPLQAEKGNQLYFSNGIASSRFIGTRNDERGPLNLATAKIWSLYYRRT